MCKNTTIVRFCPTSVIRPNIEVEHEVALQLIKARKESGLTQEEIASRMGTTQSVIARLESGKAIPSIKNSCQICTSHGQTSTL